MQRENWEFETHRRWSTHNSVPTCRVDPKLPYENAVRGRTAPTSVMSDTVCGGSSHPGGGFAAV